MKSSLRSGHDRLESGTQNGVGIAGLYAGVAFVTETGIGAIRAHEAALTRRPLEGLRAIPGVTVHGPGPGEERAPIVSATFAGIVPSEAGFLLEQGFGVLTRVGLHWSAPAAHRTIGTYPQGTVRLTPGCFTTPEEIDAAVSDVSIRRDPGRRITVASAAHRPPDPGTWLLRGMHRDPPAPRLATDPGVRTRSTRYAHSAPRPEWGGPRRATVILGPRSRRSAVIAHRYTTAHHRDTSPERAAPLQPRSRWPRPGACSRPRGWRRAPGKPSHA